ncbi:sulfatase-like hydrolase/transferase [Pontiella sulfatireligans]|uniref:Sulfatase N-terminal domain-containing protein n=1 Tax=Pontiella sulfatireligans TaxID=2750658 RepID=A0A6C2UQ46_9BACT|nr:sulfatase-like hydrolase/transferase [Pontiella sulfatireligans]SPS74502.1 sulfatase S1_24 [Kiritimatiellales bacterium]VGO22405.1 hypothetical protein SCARR_04488 [Pontiella sulfatireligans]
MKSTILFLCVACLAVSSSKALEQPNIILVFADDISARELPVYGSSVWTDPKGKNTDAPNYRAQTPVLDKMAKDGCWVTQCWGATVCSPSRAMMMTGRYAHRHKWWTNGDLGTVITDKNKRMPWPLYESSPLLIGHVAQQAGYGTFWAGKTQMKGSDLQKFGFDEGCFTPGEQGAPSNPHTDFVLKPVGSYSGPQINLNSGARVESSYGQFSWYWKPHVRLMNYPGAAPLSWWPNTPESKASFGVNTFGPDVELDFIFEYIDRQQAQKKPFFIYHTTHLGHGAHDWLSPGNSQSWTPTPKVHWDGKSYTRTDPNITGDKGIFEFNDSITEPGIHKHLEYIDYQIWLYQQKLEELGIADNTVLIFCADNGTSKYGKHSPDRQKGTHVPLIMYAPGMSKHGRQDIMVNLSDFYPTVADITGAEIPRDYEIDGESLWPYLMTNKSEHRKWVYSYRGPMQLIRGEQVMLDGNGAWWDVTSEPDDLISYREIKDWGKALEIQREEQEVLMRVIAPYDLHASAHDAPGTPPEEKKQKKKK